MPPRGTVPNKGHKRVKSEPGSDAEGATRAKRSKMDERAKQEQELAEKLDKEEQDAHTEVKAAEKRMEDAGSDCKVSKHAVDDAKAAWEAAMVMSKGRLETYRQYDNEAIRARHLLNLAREKKAKFAAAGEAYAQAMGKLLANK